MNKRDFIVSLLEKYNYEHEKLYDHFKDFKKETKSKCNFRTYQKYVAEVLRDLIVENEELSKAILEAKNHQKFQDKLRVSRKIAREDFRIYNFLEEKNDKIVELLEGISLQIPSTKEHKSSSNKVAILQVSDTHIGESIDLPKNKFNMEVASKRLQKLASKVKIYLKAHDINHVLLAFVGDLVNHDHVLDKAILNVDHKTKAMLQSVFLFEKFILDINSEANITITSVVGNESRKHEKMPHDSRLVSHSYDYDIYSFLKAILNKKKGISFIEGDFNEKVIKVLNHNILLVHGHNLKGTPEKALQGLISKHSINGVNIRFVLTGHIHSAFITPYFSRTSGLPGSNSYSNNFNMIGRAGQSLHFLSEDGSIDSISIDLQEYKDYEGYKLEDRLISNQEVKNESKDITVFKIVI